MSIDLQDRDKTNQTNKPRVISFYENHSYVCERFVGKSGASLLQKSQDECPQETISAAESIRKIYKKRTLKYVSTE